MNSRFLTLLLALAPVLARADDEDVLRFTNEDQLTGTLESLSPELLVWRSTLLDHPTPFRLDRVLDLTRTPAEPPARDGSHDAVLKLTNGDELHGQLASVTDRTIELDTWYAGKLAIPRPMVASLKINHLPKLYYRGPDSLDGWIASDRNRNAWSYDRGALRATPAGGIARDHVLPARCRIAFDLAWRSAPRLRICVFSDTPTGDSPANAYELMWQRRYINFRKRWTEKGRPNSLFLGQANIPEGMENEKARVELLCDRDKGVYNLLVDGRSAALWNDPSPQAGRPGGAIHFIAEDSTPLRISRLEVVDWDGVVENPPDDEDLNAQEEREKRAKAEAEAEQNGGLMKLRNGDSLAGEVRSIRDGVMRVKTPFAEIDLPVSRLRTIQLKPAEYDEAKWNQGDIRGWLPDGGRITFRLDQAAPGTLTGFSQNFGTATFRSDAFSRLDFNLYNPEFDSLRSDKEW